MDITCPLCGQPTPTPADILATRAKCTRCGQSFALDALPTMVPVAAPQPTPATPAESLVGRRLGGCRLVRVIGRGGMGEVYEAVQESLNRKVAVKVLPPGLAKDDAFIKRFNRESGALAQLSHPHIVAIYDRGSEAGHYYFVLEHVEGPAGSVAETLHSRLRNGPGLAPGDCARLMMQITEALAYTHGKGVIHRDIKPSNILLDARGQARLVDFGIARLVDAGPVEDHQLTLTGEVLGTTGYLAPEQREGRKDVDGRADIYSCGVVLYQMLTGRMPEGVFELPSEVVPGLPPAWDAAVEMALQRNPARRCQTMAAFLVALRAVADGQPLPARPRSTDRPAPSPATEPRGPDTAAQRTPVVGKCPKCGTVNPGDNRFCAECGVTLYETCPACKAENRVGIKFCGQCGVDLVRHRRHTDHRRQALDLGTRAGQLPPAHAAPLLRQAAGVWNTLLAETPGDTDGQTARKEIQAQLCAALLRQAQELTDSATAQPPAAAVPLLRRADGVLDDLLAEFPECEPARTARQELQRDIPARLLQQAQGLAAQAEPLPPAQAVPLLRKGAEILRALLAEFPDYEPAQIVRQELQQQLPARLLQQVQALTAGHETLQPATAVSMLRKGDELLKALLAEFPDYEPAGLARQEVQRQIPNRLLQAPQELLRQATKAAPEAALPVLKQAVTELRLVQAEFPHFVPAHETQVQAVAQLRAAFLEHARSQPPTGAVGIFREMLEHFPGDAEAAAGLEQELCTLRQRGAELISRGHFPEALTHLTEALTKAPTDGELRALKDKAERCYQQFEALNKEMTCHLEARRYMAALPLLGEMVALCPESEDLATRREQASQAVEAARQQTEEGKRLLRRGRFLKARKTCGAAVNTCADDSRAQGSLRNATLACLVVGLAANALLVGMVWSGLALLDRRAWADTQAAVQAAGRDGEKAEQLYSAYLQRSFKTAAATTTANEGIAEIRQRQGKISELLAAAKTNNSMENAWKGLTNLLILFALAPNHAEARQLLPVLQERERERQARIVELLAEANANTNRTNASIGVQRLQALLQLDANHTEAKQLLPVLQQLDRQRQTRIAELLADAKVAGDKNDWTTARKALADLFQLDSKHEEAKQLADAFPALEPAKATKAKAWQNSLGMKFVPVAGTEVLFSVWDTRVEDYQAFVTATGRAWQKPNFTQGPTHPAVYVNWEDAQEFAKWLTARERGTGKLTAGQSYRLPQDWEWSVAVGLNEARGGTPYSKDGAIKDVYPWDGPYPPPPGAGNYAQVLNVDDYES